MNVPSVPVFRISSSTNWPHYQHPDWLGTARLQTEFASAGLGQGPDVVDYDRSFAPYGEEYNNFGSDAYNLNFTGDIRTMGSSGLFDTENRELHSNQGRWISPDPAGVAAVDPSNPQTWNRYAYVANNPLSFIDPFGEDQCPDGNEADVCVVGDDGGPGLIAAVVTGGIGGGSVGGGGAAGGGATGAANTATISAQHPSVGQCLAEAALDAGLDLTSLSMLPGASQDNWQWQSAGWNSGFVYTGGGEESVATVSNGVGVLETTADFVERTPAAQAEIRQFLRSEGVKWSVKHVSKDAALLGKVAGVFGKVLAAKSAYDRYQKCRGN